MNGVGRLALAFFIGLAAFFIALPLLLAVLPVVVGLAGDGAFGGPAPWIGAAVVGVVIYMASGRGEH